MGSAVDPPNNNTRRNLTPAAVAGQGSRPGPGIAAFVALLIAAPTSPAAAQVALGGGMRFDAADVAFTGGFGGLAVDVRRVEPYGCLSHDVGVRDVQAGAAVPVVRREAVRVSLHAGTSTAVAGPAVEPDVQPAEGAGLRVGRRVGVLAEGDRARAFTLRRGAGLFVGW